MITTELFKSSLGPFDPDTTREIIRNNREAQIEAPVLSLLLTQGRTMRMGDETCTWYSADLPTRTTTINNGGAAYDASSTSIVVTNGAVFGVGDLVLAEATREVLLITGISTHTLTVVRGVGSANGAPAAHANSVANTAVLRRIGPAIGEGATVPADRDYADVAHVNTLQTFRKAVSLTGRTAVLDKQVEDPEAFLTAQAFEELIRDIEHAFMFGGRSAAAGLVDASSRKVTTMGGLYNAITTNVYAVGGAMTKAYFEGTVCAGVFARGSGQKVLIGGTTFMQTIADLYATNAAREESVEVAGMRLRRLVNMHGGELLLMPSRALAGAFVGDALVLDVDDLFRVRYTEGTLDGNPRSGLPNLRSVTLPSGQDAATKEWFAELTLQFGSQAKHARISGVTGASS